MVKPERLSDAVTLYEGDCLDVLPTLTGIDAVVTDPPYGIGRDGMRESSGSHGGRKSYEFRGWDVVVPAAEVFELMFKCSRYQIVWGANYFTRYLPSSMGWLYWDKGQKICSSDGELAFTSLNRALRSVTINRVELMKDGAVHPTQKPISLMRWCIRQLPDDAQVILDPFAGSGTTGVAAAIEGRKCILIEKDPKYCDIIRRRIADAEANGPQSLFRNVKHPDLFGELASAG